MCTEDGMQICDHFVHGLYFFTGTNGDVTPGGEKIAQSSSVGASETGWQEAVRTTLQRAISCDELSLRNDLKTYATDMRSCGATSLLRG
jgi:hypothetical protein